MEAVIENVPELYVLEPLGELCEDCRQRLAEGVILLPPAAVRMRASRPLHRSVIRLAAIEDDDFSQATWEDAEWQ